MSDQNLPLRSGTDEMRMLALFDLDIEELEQRLEMASLFIDTSPRVIVCTDLCRTQCGANCSSNCSANCGCHGVNCGFNCGVNG